MDEPDEYDGGIILTDCPNCGAFCKSPKTYRLTFSQDWEHQFTGAVADSFCKRCNTDVELPVVFL